MALRLVQIGKRFGRECALDGISLHVRRGDCYGFLGHNGAGKTTALRIALGLVRPDCGTVLVEGFDARRHPREAAARMGALVEQPGFHGGTSGRRNLELLARLGGLHRSAAASEAGRLLELVGLAGAADRRVRGYSQGMRQRLGIAQALLGDPRIVLLDEPLNGLDPEGVHDMREVLRRITRDEGRTVLVSSHQLHELAGLCNRIGILRQGRMLLEAESASLLGDGAGRYQIDVDDVPRTRALLAARGRPCEDAGADRLLVEFTAGEAAEVTRELVLAGVAVRALAPRPPTLEEIYLRCTRGEGPGGAADPDAPPAAKPPDERRAPSRPVLRVLAHEFDRLVHGVAVPLLLAAPAVVACGAVVRRWAAAQGHLRAVEQGALVSTTKATAFEGLAAGLQAGLPAMALVAAGLASQSLAGELGRGTLRNVLLRPVGRPAVLAGKALAAMAAAAASYVVTVAAAAILAGALMDYGDVVELLEIGTGQPWVVAEAATLFPVLRTALLVLVLPAAAYGALGFLAGAVTRGSAAALGLATALVVGTDLLRTVGRELSFEPALLTAHFPSPLGDTSFVRHFLDHVVAPNSVPGGHVDHAVPVSLLWAASCILLAWTALRRRDVP